MSRKSRGKKNKAVEAVPQEILAEGSGPVAGAVAHVGIDEIDTAAGDPGEASTEPSTLEELAAAAEALEEKVPRGKRTGRRKASGVEPGDADAAAATDADVATEADAASALDASATDDTAAHEAPAKPGRGRRVRRAPADATASSAEADPAADADVDADTAAGAVAAADADAAADAADETVTDADAATDAADPGDASRAHRARRGRRPAQADSEVAADTDAMDAGADAISALAGAASSEDAEARATGSDAPEHADAADPDRMAAEAVDDGASDPVTAVSPEGLEEITDDEAVELGATLPTSAASMDAVQLKHLVESLVFASDKPMTLLRLRQLTRVSDTTRLERALAELAEDYTERGIVLQQVSGGYQFRTQTKFSTWVQQLVAGRPVRLSRAQLETLAIVAYRQPITRPEIDEIRGVDSSATLKLLLDRSLIRILGKKEEVGRPMLYGTTKEFLDFFSLGDLRELPTLREYSELTDESRRVMSDELGLDPDGHDPEGGSDGGDGGDGGGGSGGGGGGGEGGGGLEPEPQTIDDIVASYTASMDDDRDDTATTGVFEAQDSAATGVYAVADHALEAHDAEAPDRPEAADAMEAGAMDAGAMEAGATDAGAMEADATEADATGDGDAMEAGAMEADGRGDVVMDVDAIDAGAMDAGAMDADATGDGGAMAMGDAVMDVDAIDAGAMDAGAMDAGAMDADAIDAGAMDAGAMDAGAMDAGAMDADATGDGGAMDAGAMEADATGDADAMDAGAMDAEVDAPDRSLEALAARRLGAEIEDDQPVAEELLAAGSTPNLAVVNEPADADGDRAEDAGGDGPDDPDDDLDGGHAGDELVPDALVVADATVADAPATATQHHDSTTD